MSREVVVNFSMPIGNENCFFWACRLYLSTLRLLIKLLLSSFFNEEWLFWFWVGKGYFRHPSKLFNFDNHWFWPNTYYLPFLNLLMNIISWKIEATQIRGCRSLENQVFVMETFSMSPRLFSATSAYLCNLKSEWLQFFRKWCSSTYSKVAENTEGSCLMRLLVLEKIRISQIGQK